MWGNHWIGGGFMWVFWFLILGGLILLIWWIVKQSQVRSPSRDEDALDILKKRYAKGEIDKEEFQEKKKDLLSEE
jgi:putative membrane protein